MTATVSIDKLIVSTPDICGGRPRIDGSRITVQYIESAHRYVIQERLKLSGCWWKLENAMTMLALRVLRANGDWDSYWQKTPIALDHHF